MKRWLDRPGVAWFFGVVVPIAIVVLDPAVFRSNMVGVGAPVLGRFRTAGYVGIALGVAVMAAALLIQKRSALIAGMLAGGSLFAAALGAAILPLSLMGIVFFGIGLLGLSRGSERWSSGGERAAFMSRRRRTTGRRLRRSGWRCSSRSRLAQRESSGPPTSQRPAPCFQHARTPSTAPFRRCGRGRYSWIPISSSCCGSRKLIPRFARISRPPISAVIG
jgi:hypothetical protein